MNFYAIVYNFDTTENVHDNFKEQNNIPFQNQTFSGFKMNDFKLILK